MIPSRPNGGKKILGKAVFDDIDGDHDHNIHIVAQQLQS